MKMNFKQRGIIWIEQILQDIRFSLRSLRKKPGFTAVAVLSLALAIGVNTGVFSIVNAMFFRPLFPLGPNEVVSVYIYEKMNNGFGYAGFTLSELSMLQESDEVFAEVSGYQEMLGGVLVSINAETRKSEALMVSDNYFSMLGLTPAMGRFFLPEESKPNANIAVAVVSQSLWKSLGGGSDFSERTVKVKGKIFDVVGVAPKGFSGTTSLVAPDVWLPFGAYALLMPDIPGLKIDDYLDNLQVNAIARLQPELTPKAAEARLTVLAPRLAAMEVEAADRTRTLEIEPPSRFGLFDNPMSGEKQREFRLALMVGIAGIVLLMACLNLANMFLARNITRSDELAVRLALGASRWRIVRILSAEGLIIALMGGAVGLMLSHWVNGLLLGSLVRTLVVVSEGPGQASSLLLNTTPDIRVLLATLLFCVIATLLFALIPAWHITRDITRGNFSLQHSTRTTTDRWGRLFSGRHCMLMAQLALSLALLFSTGLFMRAAISAARLDLGFEPEGNLVAEINYGMSPRDPASVLTSITAIEDALGAYPDVRKVAIASDIPFETNGISGFQVSTVGATNKEAHYAEGRCTYVSRGYFDVLGIKLLRGRDFTEKECLQSDGPSVVIIDEGTASALFPDEDPVGKYIRNAMFDSFGDSESQLVQGMAPTGGMSGKATASEPMQIVGVVSAFRDGVEAESPPLRLFYPRVKNKFWSSTYIIMRGQTTEAAKTGAFRELVRKKLLSLDPDIFLARLTPYTDFIDSDMTLWTLKFCAVLFGIFGAFALLLAVIGAYGVKAFAVACRMREIGIRMALGASPRRIYALLMKQGALLIAIGLCIGLMLSLAAGRLLASLTAVSIEMYMTPRIPLLLRVSPSDPLVLALAGLILALAALLATWLPARRASKVDPMEVLRWE